MDKLQIDFAKLRAATQLQTADLHLVLNVQARTQQLKFSEVPYDFFAVKTLAKSIYTAAYPSPAISLTPLEKSRINNKKQG